METESRTVVASSGGQSYFLMGIEFQFYKMRGVLEMVGGDGCTHNECI